VLPNNIEYNPLVALMFLFGLALLSVVNTTIYEKIEQKLMDSVRAMENWLENVHYYRKGREGYYVFKSLSPNIQVSKILIRFLTN
jgi:potassium channel subfamily K protein